MPFDASGGFYRLNGRVTGPDIWKDDAGSVKKIRSDYHDTHDNDLAQGLANTICRDGQSQVIADIPWGGNRIKNVADPEEPQDVATRHWVDVVPGWGTSKNLSGADADGRLNFTSLTGVNGITWTGADLAWLAKLAKDNETSHRLVLNDAASGSGNDVFKIDDGGRITINGVITHNISYSANDSKWRTPVAGKGTYMGFSNGTLTLQANDTPTTVAYAEAIGLRQFFAVQHSFTTPNASTSLILNKKGLAGGCNIYGQNDSKTRWLMQLGNTVAEVATTTDRGGSDFNLVSYDNAGLNGVSELLIDRSTHKATFGGDVTLAGQLNFDSIAQSTDAACILASTVNGTIYLRPNGAGSATEQVTINNQGDVTCATDIWAGGSSHTVYGIYAGAGLREKAASNGGYGAEWINFTYVAPGDFRAYAGVTHRGTIPAPSDYRLKRDIEPLGSTWDKVKGLHPVRYQWKDGDGERWGFIAHQLQEDLVPGAATGNKDMKDGFQSPDAMAVIAALTSALQEAMLRIEALEAGS